MLAVGPAECSSDAMTAGVCDSEAVAGKGRQHASKRPPCLVRLDSLDSNSNFAIHLPSTLQSHAVFLFVAQRATDPPRWDTMTVRRSACKVSSTFHDMTVPYSSEFEQQLLSHLHKLPELRWFGLDPLFLQRDALTARVDHGPFIPAQHR